MVLHVAYMGLLPHQWINLLYWPL